MSKTKKNIIDDILIILYKSRITDEARTDPDWLSAKIDDVRATFIRQEYAQTGIVDMQWLSDLQLLTCYPVNSADNVTITCGCNISKTTIPSIISLSGKQGNQDLGLYSVTSACGTKGITPFPMTRWTNIPAENPMSLFTYYFRISSALYISKVVDKIRVVALLLSPEDGYLINSAPIASGSLVSGTVYYVKGGTVVYNSVPHAAGTTFTANATTTYTTTSGSVYLYSQIANARDTDIYPASGDMIRNIELEILTKEFGIEKQQIADIRNDSIDDAQKVA